MDLVFDRQYSASDMTKDILGKHGIAHINHFAPIHYLVFIARSRSLKGKSELRSEGFEETHFRTMSRQRDINRGFGNYAFLTTDGSPRILKAKLKAGFPHIAIAVPSSTIEQIDFYLCRYNVAMTRRLRRNGTIGFSASGANGRYYNAHQLPVASEVSDKDEMLRTHFRKGAMIEVLVSKNLTLPEETAITCFSAEDVEMAEEVVRAAECPWTVRLSPSPGPYNRRHEYAREAQEFIRRALDDPSWRGNGLEFDRV